MESLIQQSDCFLPLKLKAQELPCYLNGLICSELPWQKHFGFDCVEIEKSWIDKEPALKAVHSLHKIKQLGLLRVESLSMYDWHVDGYRQSCLNMLISENHNSITLFGNQRDYVNKNIIQLKYEPRTYYLFNNQMQHCVINLDEPRYLFSLYFESETPYSQLKELMEENHVA